MMKRILFALAAFFILAAPAQATCGAGSSVCFWIGTAGGNWATVGNWANTSPGGSSGTTPATTDTVCFDSNGVNNSTISASITVAGVNTAGTCAGGSASPYTGTITQNASTNLTIGGNDAGVSGGTTFLVSSSSGWTAAANTAAVIFTATSGTSTFTPNSSGASRNFGNVTFNGAGGTFKLGSAITSSASSTITLTAGTFDNNTVNADFGCWNAGAGSGTRAVNNATGTWTLRGVVTGCGTVFDVSASTNFTNVTTAFSSLTLVFDAGTTNAGRGVSVGGMAASTIGAITLPANAGAGNLLITGPSTATVTITTLSATGNNTIVFAGGGARVYAVTTGTLSGSSTTAPIIIENTTSTSAPPTVNGNFSGNFVALTGIGFGTGTQSFTNCWNAGVTSSGTLTCTPPAAGGGRIIGG